MQLGMNQRVARLLGWTVVALGIVAGVWLSRREEAQATDESPPAERAAEVVRLTVEPTVERREHVFHSVVRTTERAVLSFVDGGRVVARPARVGDRVSAGDLLAQLDPTPYRNSVRASAATRRELDLRSEQLARDRDRAARLAGNGVTTTARLEQAENGFDRVQAMRVAARAQVSESRRRRREGVLRAPFDGVVTDVLAEPGELVAPGQPVVRLAGVGGREVQLDVPVAVAAHLRAGDEVRMRAVGIDAGDPLARLALVGHVRAVTSDAASIGGLFPVIVDIETPTRAGLGVEARLQGPPHEALRVPLGAVLDPSGRRPFVWTVVDQHAVRAWLRLGRLDGENVEVSDGLEAGAVVVIRGHQRLLEGDRVSARSPAGGPS